MRPESPRVTGVLLVLMPTVVFGGASILTLLTLLIGDPAYAPSQLRHDPWRAGHAHASGGRYLWPAWPILSWALRLAQPGSCGHRRAARGLAHGGPASRLARPTGGGG